MNNPISKIFLRLASLVLVYFQLRPQNRLLGQPHYDIKYKTLMD
jgi:hypothetical protein